MVTAKSIIGAMKNHRFINERSKIVDEKNRIGAWQIDTIIGKQQTQAVISIVERFSKKRFQKNSIASATIDDLKLFSNAVLNITADNGSEFAYYDYDASLVNVYNSATENKAELPKH